MDDMNVSASVKRYVVFGAACVCLGASTISAQVAPPSSTPTSAPGTASVSAPHYEVASIRQNLAPEPRWRMNFTDNGVSAKDVTLFYAIKEAYEAYDDQLWINIPDWIKEKRFDIEARYDVEKYPHPTLKDRQPMLQQLLPDRFHLAIHHELKEFSVFALEIGKNGSKFTGTKPEDIRPSEIYGAMCMNTKSLPGTIGMEGCAMQQFADSLTGWTRSELGREILDRTGLPGRYTMSLTWSRQTSGPSNPSVADTPETPTGPSVFTALQEQLGLTLKPAKAPLDTLVVDHVEMPTEN
jgi:uncharacterized protein (TIGR03435 family)